MTIKTCPRCGERKSLDEFNRMYSGAHGRKTYCRACESDLNSGDGIKSSNLQFSKVPFRPRLGVERRDGFGGGDFSLRSGLSNPQPVAAPVEAIDLSKLEIPCPCCRQPVRSPAVEIIIENYGISEFEARILGAIWRGKGRPVATERVFDAMYCDDPDGGPSRMKMYEAFKFGLHRLRGRLEGSGVGIVNVGYRRGYKLVMKENG